VGAGALGPVFRCYDPETDRVVAVKAFPLDITPEQASELAAAFAHLATLNLAHPSIIAPLGAGAEGSTAFLVQEYFVAESVDVALRQYGPAPIPDALRLVGQLAGAIDFAAVTGVRHGSLHPRDILVAPHEVRLTGLGVAQSVEQIGFRVAPRRPYSARERVEGQPWTTAADVFALAAVAFELLTGKRPSTSAEPFPPDTTVDGAADCAALGEAFARAFSVRAEDRFPTALSFAAALRHALTGEPLDLPATGVQHPHVARRRERGVRAASLPLAPKPETGPVLDLPEAPPAAVSVIPEPESAALREEPASSLEEPVLSLGEPVASPEEPESSLEEPVSALDEPASSAADQLLAAPEPEAADFSLQPPGLEPDRLQDVESPETERFTVTDSPDEAEPRRDAERFAALQPFGEVEPRPERGRFATLEPPDGPGPPAGTERFADLEARVDREPDPPEPPAVRTEPGVEREPLAAEPLARAERLDATEPIRETRADEIRMTPREEVPMPSPPPVSSGPDRPFTPPPSGRGTASFRRPKLPLSWLLAMLLLGVLGGFVGGYLLGSGDHREVAPADDLGAETVAAPQTSAEPARHGEPQGPPTAAAPAPATPQQPPAGEVKPGTPPAGNATPPPAAPVTPRRAET